MEEIQDETREPEAESVYVCTSSKGESKKPWQNPSTWTNLQASTRPSLFQTPETSTEDERERKKTVNRVLPDCDISSQASMFFFPVRDKTDAMETPSRWWQMYPIHSVFWSICISWTRTLALFFILDENLQWLEAVNRFLGECGRSSPPCFVHCLFLFFISPSVSPCRGRRLAI